jgi:hypothetical protein
MTEIDERILVYLRRFPGQELPYFTVLNDTIRVINDHDPVRHPMREIVRRQTFKAVVTALHGLTKRRAVIRRRHSEQRRKGNRIIRHQKDTLRINEALVLQKPFYTRA